MSAHFDKVRIGLLGLFQLACRHLDQLLEALIPNWLRHKSSRKMLTDEGREQIQVPRRLATS